MSEDMNESQNTYVTFYKMINSRDIRSVVAMEWGWGGRLIGRGPGLRNLLGEGSVLSGGGGRTAV